MVLTTVPGNSKHHIRTALKSVTNNYDMIKINQPKSVGTFFFLKVEPTSRSGVGEEQSERENLKQDPNSAQSPTGGWIPPPRDHNPS